ncbi:hypothetical protein Pfo_031282 [Paulownia fortunei]|nr:hypothetical protein Pfo_031282 [Paulownia fortunei]
MDYSAKTPTSPGRITQSIDKKVQCLPTSINGELPSIFRVHQGLRRNNPESYTPMLVSVGPYHHANPNLLLMEDWKLSYLHSFLARRSEESVGRYVIALQESKHMALSCYAHQSNIDDDAFVEMMLLDGCFVVEFVRRYSELEYGRNLKDDPIFGVDWMKTQVCRDLMLLENQLPYFVLSELYDLNEMNASDDGKEPFSNLAMLVFSDMFPKLCPASIFSTEIEERGIKHLLHLVHVLCRPISSDLKSLEGNSISGSEVLDPMRCVKELEEAGITFKKVGKVYAGIDSLDADTIDDRVSLFDIKFNEGLMEIPSLKVEDSTNTFFRNLIAYEQHSSDVRPKYFTDYAVFMDQLINTDQDVNVLRRSGIIVNLLGDDGEVATLFNKLGDGVITSSNFYYLGTCNQVNQYCGKIWNVVMAKLRHDYFNSPWATVSTIAAVVLLLLTIIQTIASVIPLYS